ncbi:phage tail tape measure protein [Psychrobacter fulvigenes]|uniref:phage tail tape measure protein n=1 Tax=Psychrobacter fulvigenes TaxID=533323 RepID=UPI0019199023|nr:phage tail tape measure protein [Psychrobacter fulvigenes]
MSTQTVSLRLQLTGNAGPELRRIAQQNIRDTRSINDMNRLGLRTQRQIDREIRNQQRSYRRLRDSGVASANDIRRAHRAMREEVRRLNGELRTSGSLMGKMQTAGAVVGGVVAGAAVVNSQIKPARTYDEQVARAAATATYGQGMSVAERKLIKVELDKTVMDAVRSGGGTREGAIAAADTLIASGQYDLSSVKEVLGATQRASFVTDAQSTDAAAVTLQLRNFGLNPQDIARGQDIAVAGGQMGGFEYDTMAQYLSRQLPLAKSAGYGGLDGLRKIVAMNQVAINTAGNQDEAGNNVVNLLQKLNSREFRMSINKKIEPQAGDPTIPKAQGGGLDWPAYARQQKAQGVDQVDAFVSLLERQLSGDSQYQALKQQAGSAKGKEAQALYEQMSEMLEGSNLGEVIADRQALMAALAISTNGAENERIKSGLDKADGTIDDLYEVFKGDEWATAMSRQQEQLNINYGLYKQVNEQLSGFNQSLGGFMERHEGLATAAYAAGTALAAIGAAGAIGGLLGGTGGAAGAAKGAAKFAGKAGLVGAAGVAGYGVGTVINDKLIAGTALGDGIGEKVAQALALFGNDTAQAALDANAKTDQLIAEQQQTKAKQDEMVREQSQTKQIQSQMASQQSIMISHLSAIAAKPVPTFNPTITIGGHSTAMNMMSEIDKQSKRGKYGPYRN